MKYPMYICGFCQAKIQLKFNPLINPVKLKNWRCPRCRKRRKTVLKMLENKKLIEK